ncbi:hypothetical protein ADUPG1_002440 [Aduncisulcus paluster]|uniref:Uncharacterized protein n=1 Tax=Aduncisulcus paluster TaxID=2918883 RepID=A0ABQ5KPA5_9EUKA|nr:hypothetical protein ADUPG1_002440 [Aduncisulcus paluster]
MWASPSPEHGPHIQEDDVQTMKDKETNQMDNIMLIDGVLKQTEWQSRSSGTGVTAENGQSNASLVKIKKVINGVWKHLVPWFNAIYKRSVRLAGKYWASLVTSIRHYRNFCPEFDARMVWCSMICKDPVVTILFS